ncbi:8-oxo-dGTP diphosphatase MutT [Hyphomonas sp. FCG-A18]|uniref:8-oxo-dGTP diphosphatase MutT n=1 Tax=Hyphomonas sp. FCG-A18 TaxID=3080019 RepID=UPI002B2EEE6C|nr:8-oxo-dGTP diphosphatase MutT [Hyphomonas sp. FCG-A18]
MTKLVLVVAAALFNERGEVLLAQRPEGKSMAGLWEFPGGKIEAGETPEIALARELNEELGIVCKPEDFQSITFVSHSYEDFHLLMPLFGLKEWRGELRSIEGQVLEWVNIDRLHDYPAPAADIPIFNELIARKHHAETSEKARDCL